MYDGRGGHDGLGMPNDLMDTYASEDVESQLLGGGKHHRVRTKQPLPRSHTRLHLACRFTQCAACTLLLG